MSMPRIPTIRYAPLLKVAGQPGDGTLEDVVAASLGADAELYDLVAVCAEYRAEVTEALAGFGLTLSGNDVCGPSPKPGWWLNPEDPRFQQLAAAVTAVELVEKIDRYRVTTAAELLNQKLIRIGDQYARLHMRIGAYEDRVCGSEPDRELSEEQQAREQRRIYMAADAVAGAFDEHPRALVRLWAEQPPSPQLLQWSGMGDVLSVEALGGALMLASGRIINVYEVDTGTEDIAVVISAVVLTEAEVIAVYEAAGSIPWADAVLTHRRDGIVRIENPGCIREVQAMEAAARTREASPATHQ